MAASCLACGGSITYPLYHPDGQPLAAVSLPRSRQAAMDAPRLPMNFRVCACCGHIFNVEFDYRQVPYQANAYLMYNRGRLWLEHMQRLVDQLVDRYDAAGKTLVDIGCGDGLFLKLLRERQPACRCIGFEPGEEAEIARRNGLTVYRDLFEPKRDLRRLRPDFLVCRHVLEHLRHPRSFVASIAHWCNRCRLFPVFLAEVPRIDKALQQGRVTDFLYEHVSNFTESSFQAMFAAAGFELLDLQSCYGDEVAVAFVRPTPMPHLAATGRQAKCFRRRIAAQQQQVRAQLDALCAAGKSVAFWGGTSKGAAFLNAFGISADRFPVVIDSDRNKAGRFVPGAGQEIRPPEYLHEHPAEVIVITTRWRAKDIFEEIRRRQIRCETVLVLEGEQLRPYAGEPSWEDERSVRIESAHPVLPRPRGERQSDPWRWSPSR